MSSSDGGDALLASEHAEPGASAAAALDALADEATMVVAVRTPRLLFFTTLTCRNHRLIAEIAKSI